ncbi:MAG: hypothetical protein KBE16_07965 [Alphaproteobacteria bacterium]|nr:hypothetical protein [Alphaproteobacteria bacterium]MBP9878214.1 hypothetical protein [Alphaproteobacteria bacterium]
MKIQKRGVKACSVPAPQEGLDHRLKTGVDSAEPFRQALQLENWVVLDQAIQTRKGYRRLTDCETPIERLHSHDMNNEKKLLACGGGAVYELKAMGEHLCLKSGFSSDQWRITCFHGASLFMNGCDDPHLYKDGGFEPISFQGFDNPHSLSGAMVYQSRLFYWSHQSLTFWYGDIHTIGGKLQAFPLSLAGDYRGTIMHIDQMMLSGPKGVQNAFVIFLSSGQVVVYRGLDPGRAETWALLCTVQISKPLTSDCVLSYAGDLLVIGEEGYFFLSKYLGGDERLTCQGALLSELQKAIRLYAKQKGWSLTFDSIRDWIIINVPNGKDSEGKLNFSQHVFDLSRAVWMTFTGIQSSCWHVHDGALLFASDASVYRAFDAPDDEGRVIKAYLKMPWFDFGRSSVLKKVSMVKARFESHGFESAALGIAVDHQEQKKRSCQIRQNKKQVSLWGSMWNRVLWSRQVQVKDDWQTVHASGYALSLDLNLATHEPVTYYGSEMIFEQGGLI